MTSLTCVCQGKQNRIRAQAPTNSKPQYNIDLVMSDGTIIHEPGWSGWYVWKDGDEWCHLGGGSNRTPTIYKLIKTETKWKWSRRISQDIAQDCWNTHGKLD